MGKVLPLRGFANRVLSQALAGRTASEAGAAELRL